MNVYIHENSLIARIAAWKLGVSKCAIVVGATIHLHQANREDILNNTRWLRHEICHVRQWKREGYLRFLVQYLYQSVRKGYHENSYEVEAREAEDNLSMLNDIQIK